MFGPNTHFINVAVISYSHRDKEFLNLYEKFINNFKDVFKLHDYDIMLIPGSGTVGIEALMFSSKWGMNVSPIIGKFHQRWYEMARQYNKNNDYFFKLYCQLETSISKYYEEGGCIVDCISSFPYYNIPKDTKAFVLSSNKQLGSYTGISIVGIKKDHWMHFIGADTMSYLNLARYKRYAKSSQTPSTFPSHILEHLNSNLIHFSTDALRERINRISDRIVEEVGEDNIIGEGRCPVITIKKSAIPNEIAAEYNLYGLNTNSAYYQIFTYSCYEVDYNEFLIKLRWVRK